MTIENAIKAKSVEYAALRANLRARARDWVDQRTSSSATNARRQLNQAFDAGVSATIELLRDREPLNLTAEEIDTLIALREGAALVIPSRAERDRSFDVGSYPVGYGVEEGDRSGVRGASGAPTAEADPRRGSTPDERETDRDVACDIDGRELFLEARVVWTGEILWGPATVKFISQDGKRVKVEFDNLPRDLRQIKPGELRMIDGAV